jgi:hypothetical protein
MIAVTLVFSVMFFVMSIILGGVVGWLYRGYTFSQHPMNMHPEMFDVNGNIIPDEIIAFNFNGDYDEEEEPED